MEITEQVVRRPRIHEKHKILEIARAVATTIDEDFYWSFAQHLAHAAGASCAVVAQFERQPSLRVKTIATWLHGERATNIEFDPAGTMADSVLQARRLITTGAAACQTFPKDPVLQKAGAKAAVAIPLVESQGNVIGVCIVTYSKPLADVSLPVNLLSTFASRASAELERKLERETLKRSEQRYRAFIAGGLDGMWRIEFSAPVATNLPEDFQIQMMKENGRVAECNDTLAAILGFKSAADIIGSPFNDFITSPDTVETLREFIRSGYRATNSEVVVNLDGKHQYRLRSLWGVVQASELHRIWGITRDVTDLRLTEMDLQASRQRFYDVLETVQLLVAVVDSNGKITFSNEQLQRLSGWTGDELTRKDWFEVLTPPEERDSARSGFLRALSSSKSPYRVEGHLLTRQGARRLIAWDKALLKDAAGSVNAVAALGRDITEQRAIEINLQKLEKLDSIGRLAAGVAHDFSNLLTIILGNAETLKNVAERDSLPFQRLTNLIDAAEKGSVLIKQLLTFSRVQPFKPELLNLNELIAKNENLFRRLICGNTKMVIDLDPDLRPTLADAGQICQVLMNLIINARDAMPNGGCLSISTENVIVQDEPIEPFLDAAPASYVLLRVSDTGIGIDDKVRSRLFEPFFTTKPEGKGTGLGLSAAFGIVKQHGGYIGVDSEPGVGASFAVMLPVFKSEE